MLNITLRKHRLFAAMISMAAFLTLGTVNLANNTNIVSAKTRTIKVQSTKQQNHYIKLANRPGTHYFKNYKIMMRAYTDTLYYAKDTGNTGSPIYTMSGKIDNNYDPDPGYTIVAIGTKTIGNKHFFIAKDSDGKYMRLAKDFYVPTCYKLKKGHHITAYRIPVDNLETAATNPVFVSQGRYVWNKQYSRVLIVSPKTQDGRVWYKGEAYRSVYDQDGSGNSYFKEKDIKKNLVKAKGSFGAMKDTYNGNKIVHIAY